MRTVTVIRRLAKHLPKTAQEVLDTCELPLQYIGGGAFRDAYHVIGTNVIIKIPRKGRTKKTTEANIQHARDEYRIWRRIRYSRRKYSSVVGYLPNLIYYNSRTGVIVMEKYQKVRYCKENNQLIAELESDIVAVMGTEEADIHYGNLGQDAKGNIKIIDMGLFIKGKV